MANKPSSVKPARNVPENQNVPILLHSPLKDRAVFEDAHQVLNVQDAAAECCDLSRKHTGTRGEKSVAVQSLRQFLDLLSAIAPVEEYCPSCYSVLSHLESHCSIKGAAQLWKVRVPYCPICHPDVALRQTYLV